MSPDARLLRAIRRDAFALALSILALLACLVVSGAARADALDDTLAKFLDDKFPQTEKAIGELAAEAPPQARRDPRSARRQSAADRPRRSYRRLQDRGRAQFSTPGPARRFRPRSPEAFKKVRVNNALRRAIEGAMGSLTLANPDPEKRLAAAEDVFRTRDAKALPALEAQLAKESDPRVADAFRLARAAILATSDTAYAAGSACGDRNH